jgi:hypothetical protein
MASFYRRLVPNFASISNPLTTLIRKDQEFIWEPSQQEAFENLKSRLCSTTVLPYPNFKLPFILTTDASKVAIAAILSQVQGGVERFIAYAIGRVNTAEEAYTISEIEILAFVWATKYFRCYLYGSNFSVGTDHSALPYSRNFAHHKIRLLRWSWILSELDF